MKPHYQNPWPHEEHGLLDILKWKLGLGPREVPELPDAPDQPAGWQRVTREQIAVPPAAGWRALWLGHSSFLLQGNGVSLLVDPIFSAACGPLPLPTLRRKVPLPCALEDLPTIAAVLLTHSHYDHLDLPTLRRLGRSVPLVVAEGHAAWLRRMGFTQVTELPWFATADLAPGVRVTATPAQHFTDRTFRDRNRGHWCGWLIESGGTKLWHAGDTGFCDGEPGMTYFLFVPLYCMICSSPRQEPALRSRLSSMATPEKLTFGSYEVVRNADGTPCILGQGSFGVTYKARHILLGRVNALKVIREDLLNRGSKEDQEETKRFLGEARAVGRLQHPGIAVVHDCALDGGVFYYAMEYCDGGSLQDWCAENGAMEWSEVRPMALQIATALDYAHGSGFLHRDLKPSNIMLTGEGAMRQAKLIDFGLAKKFAVDAEASTATIRNDKENFRGNYATASPEQILEKPLDPRSDLFSLGVTLWWLLIGKNPFGGMKHGPMIADRVGPSSYASSLPGDLDPEARLLLEGLLEKDVARRIATAIEVVGRLDHAAVDWVPGDASAASVVGDSSGPAAGFAVDVMALPGPPDLEDAYAVGAALASANQAKLYTGENLATRQPVIVIIPDASLDLAARGGMRVAASRKLDFGAYAFLDWRFSGGDDVFVISKPEGCSLMAVLRKFGTARFVDALPFLSHLARCFDASETWTTFGIQVEPGEILLGTRDGSADINRIRSWADLDPLATRCLPLFTTAGDHGASSEATLSTSAHEFPPMAQFAALVYRVLSGSAVKYASFFTASGYVMASGLSEDGNALLATTISDPATQPSACRFMRSLAGLESLPVAGISPLVAPPEAHDLAAGKLDPVPVPGSSSTHGPRVRPLPAAPGTPATMADKLAEIERQLAQAKLAAEKESLKETADAGRKKEQGYGRGRCAAGYRNLCDPRRKVAGTQNQ